MRKGQCDCQTRLFDKQKHHDAFIVIYDLYIEHQHEY